MTVVVLAGGTGGAKLARGLLDVVGADELVVVANTGDDVEIYETYVSPDPDLVTFWLGDVIDERGWGLRDDTFEAMSRLEDVWFNLGDRDLELCRRRAEALARGERATVAQAAVAEAVGVRARVLPMSDDPVRTVVRAGGAWWPFQEFMIRRRGEGPVEDVRFDGLADATPTPEVLEAIASARAVLIGPSNPVISIEPILGVPGMRDALAASPGPVVGVSPIVGGQVLKGPTAAFMAWAGRSLDAAGVADAYAGVLDGMVCDERADLPVPALVTDTLLAEPEQRERLAREALDFALALA